MADCDTKNIVHDLNYVEGNVRNNLKECEDVSGVTVPGSRKCICTMLSDVSGKDEVDKHKKITVSVAGEDQEVFEWQILELQQLEMETYGEFVVDELLGLEGSCLDAKGNLSLGLKVFKYHKQLEHRI